MIGPDGHVRILDFGIATMAADSAETATRLTAVGFAGRHARLHAAGDASRPTG